MSKLKNLFKISHSAANRMEGASKIAATADSGAMTASFAMSWFWFPEAQFGCVPGVLRTRVGFSGGATKSPSYHDLGDHTEAVQIDYNPATISYPQLLKIFWENHNSTVCTSRQYMSAIFCHNEEQLLLANQTKEEHQKSVHKPIQTKIKPFESFYNAENYHQKYLLRNQRKLFSLLNLTDAELIESVLAAKLNGYVGGFGSLTNLDKDLEGSNLPQDMKESLKAHITKKSSY